MADRYRFGWVLASTLAILAVACVPAPASRSTPDPAVPAEIGSDLATAATGTPITAPASQAGPTAAPSFVRPTPNPSPTFFAYVVRPGDSLTTIARRFGTSARSLAFWNRAQHRSLDPDSAGYDPSRIEVGWTLQLIPGQLVDEDDLPDPTPTPMPTPPVAPSALAPEASGSPS